MSDISNIRIYTSKKNITYVILQFNDGRTEIRKDDGTEDIILRCNRGYTIELAKAFCDL